MYIKMSTFFDISIILITFTGIVPFLYDVKAVY